jgi:hypothetical protein
MREYAGKSESGLYFDGFTVDDHGAIRILWGAMLLVTPRRDSSTN